MRIRERAGTRPRSLKYAGFQRGRYIENGTERYATACVPPTPPSPPQCLNILPIVCWGARPMHLCMHVFCIMYIFMKRRTHATEKFAWPCTAQPQPPTVTPLPHNNHISKCWRSAAKNQSGTVHARMSSEKESAIKTVDDERTHALARISRARCRCRWCLNQYRCMALWGVFFSINTRRERGGLVSCRSGLMCTIEFGHAFSKGDFE